MEQADKRAHHNALERKRRDHIKASFNKLRNALPAHMGEKASRTQILQKSVDYIQTEKKKCLFLQKELENIRKQNQILEEECKVLEEKSLAQKTTGTSAASSILETSRLNRIGHAMSVCDTSSSSESSPMESSDDEERH